MDWSEAKKGTKIRAERHRKLETWDTIWSPQILFQAKMSALVEAVVLETERSTEV